MLTGVSTGFQAYGYWIGSHKLIDKCGMFGSCKLRCTESRWR